MINVSLGQLEVEHILYDIKEMKTFLKEITFEEDVIDALRDQLESSEEILRANLANALIDDLKDHEDGC